MLMEKENLCKIIFLNQNIGVIFDGLGEYHLAQEAGGVQEFVYTYLHLMVVN